MILGLRKWLPNTQMSPIIGLWVERLFFVSKENCLLLTFMIPVFLYRINYPAASGQGMKRKDTNFVPLTLTLSPRRGDLVDTPPQADWVLENMIKEAKR
jgi:hypothetical protein